MTNDDIPTLEFNRNPQASIDEAADGQDTEAQGRDPASARDGAPTETDSTTSTNTAQSAQTAQVDAEQSHTAPPLWSTTRPDRYIHVPSSPANQTTVPHHSGPSAPTLVLAGMMLFLAVAVGLVAWRFPKPFIPNLWNNPTLSVAVIFGVLGVILLAVALCWAVAAGVHAVLRHRRDAQ